MNASRIQHNIASMNAYRNYTGNSNRLGSNLEKLSSGYKINRAGDDAAGLAISEKMRAQITGLEVAQKNAKDGISVVQTAEGALTEVHDMLNRMYSLAEQSANGIYTTTERQKLQDEVDALSSEIDRISQATNFNGIQLLDGSLGGSSTTSVVSANASAAYGTLGSIGNDILTASPTTGYAATFETTATYGAVTASAKVTASVVQHDATTATVQITVGAITLGGGTGDLAVGASISTAESVQILVGDTVLQIDFSAVGAHDGTTIMTAISDAIATKVGASWSVDIGSLALGSAAGSKITLTAKVGGEIDATAANNAYAALSQNLGANNSTHFNVDTTGNGADTYTEVTIGSNSASYAGVSTATGTTTAMSALLADHTGAWTYAFAEIDTTTEAGKASITLVATTVGNIDTSKISGSFSDAVALTAGADTCIDFKLTIGNQSFTAASVAGYGANSVIQLSDGSNTIDVTLKQGVDPTAALISETLGMVATSSQDSALVLQIGDDNNPYNQLKVSITSMGAANLFGSTGNAAATDGNGKTVTRYVDIMDATSANVAMSTIKAAIEKVSVTRGNLGAIQNRLEHTINNLGTTRENLQDAESAIRDTDVAEEMMKYTKNSIMNQAAQAMLAQANQLPQGVLQLLQ